MKLYKSLIILLLFIAGCSSSTPFEKHVRKGKDALKSENYEVAVKEFKNALIESPRDEDVKILFDHSLERFNIQEAKKVILNYYKEVEGVIGNYEDTLMQYKDKENDRTVAKTDVINAQNVSNNIEEIKSVGEKYKEYSLIKKMNDDLIDSMKDMHDYILGENNMKSFLAKLSSERRLGEFKKKVLDLQRE